MMYAPASHNGTLCEAGAKMVIDKIYKRSYTIMVNKKKMMQ
jgi:hypothetical protein